MSVHTHSFWVSFPFLLSCFMGLEGFGVDALSDSTLILNLVWGYFNAGNTLVQHCPTDTSMMMGKFCRDREMFFTCATCCTRETLDMCLLSLRNWFSISLHVNSLNFKLKKPQVARGPCSSLSSFYRVAYFQKRSFLTRLNPFDRRFPGPLFVSHSVEF